MLTGQPLDRQEDLHVPGQGFFCKPDLLQYKLLRNSEVDSRLLSYDDISCLSTPKLMNFSSPFFSLLVAFLGFESVKKLLGNGCSADFNSHLFPAQHTDLKDYRDNCDYIVEIHEHRWSIAILPRKYYHVSTLSVVAYIGRFQSNLLLPLFLLDVLYF